MFEKIRKSEFMHVMGFMEKRLRMYFFCILFDNTLSALCFNIVLAIIMRDLFNAAIKGQRQLLYRAVTLSVISIVVPCIFQPVLRYTLGRLTRKTMVNIREKAYRHLKDLPISYFEKNHSGDIMSRLNNDIGAIEAMYSGQIGNLVLTIILGISAIALMFNLEWHLALLLVMVGVLSGYVNVLFSNPLRQGSDAIQQQRGTLTERLADLIAGYNITKMFRIQKIITQRYFEKSEDVSKSFLKRAHMDALLNVSNCILNSIRTMGMIVIGIYMTMRNFMDFGTLVAIYQLQGNMSYMFDNLGKFVSQIQGSLAGASRVLELLNEPLEPEKLEFPHDSDCSSMIKLANVCFGYSESKKVLDNISIEVEKGQTVALIGPSGGGKTTVIKLLLGFYQAEEGNIFVEGKSIGQYTLKQLREMIAYVPQDLIMFAGTIEENIRYGNLDAEREEIIAAAKAANAHNFIMEQPNGYNTLIGERGAKLSGGQRQRIAIAQALLKGAPILLLDEATSALDSESEQIIQETISNLVNGRTVLIIAHSLSTIETADTIYVLDEGKVVECGRHYELLKIEGLYKRLYDLQFQQN